MSLEIELTAMRPTEVFCANLTRNLMEIADLAGIRDYLWNPQKMNIKTANDLITPLGNALDWMKTHQELLRTTESGNGWGTYKDLVCFVERYWKACKANPDAEVSVR